MSVLESSSKRARSFNSTSSAIKIFISISRGGWDVFVHHFETVVGVHPNCLESQRFDFFFSARITFKRLFAISSLFNMTTKIII